MAAAFAAAFFGKKPILCRAIVFIMIANMLTRFWGMAYPNYTLGYALIDLALLTVFVEARRRTGKEILTPLIWLQAVFMGLHLAGEIFDFSGQFLGVERSHHYVSTWWLNRVFELEILYVFSVGVRRILLLRSNNARKLAGSIRDFRHTSREKLRLMIDKIKTTVPAHNRD